MTYYLDHKHHAKYVTVNSKFDTGTTCGITTYLSWVTQWVISGADRVSRVGVIGVTRGTSWEGISEVLGVT